MNIAIAGRSQETPPNPDQFARKRSARTFRTEGIFFCMSVIGRHLPPCLSSSSMLAAEAFMMPQAGMANIPSTTACLNLACAVVVRAALTETGKKRKIGIERERETETGGV